MRGWSHGQSEDSEQTKATVLIQDAILTIAAAWRYGHVLPLPEDTDATSAKATKLLKAMLAAGLIEEYATSSAKNAWRSNDGTERLGYCGAGNERSCV